MAEKRKMSDESTIISNKQSKTTTTTTALTTTGTGTGTGTGDSRIATSNQDDQYVRIKFVNQENLETHLKVMRNSKLGKAFTAYSNHHNLHHQLHFTFDGMRVNPNLTADDLNIRDGVVFDVFSYVHGGGDGGALG